MYELCCGVAFVYILMSRGTPHTYFALEFILENKPTPPYAYGLGKVGTTSGSEHRTEQR